MALSKLSNNSYGGLKVRNENEINITLFCELCKLLLFDPTQLLCCGTRLCRWCSKNGLSNGEPFVCSFCNTKKTKKEALADRGTGRELNLITTECYACSWKGLYKDYIEHLQEYHAILECDDCHERFSVINLYEEHRQEICESRSVPCGLPGCMEKVKWPKMEAHYLLEQHQRILVEFICQFIILSSRRQVQQDWSAVIESVGILFPGLDTLLNESQRLRAEHDEMKTTVEQKILELNEIVKSLNESDEKLVKNQQCLVEMEKDINETKKRTNNKIYLLDVDGTITLFFNYHNQEITSLFSSIFKTSAYSYPFILRLCSTIEPGRKNEGYLSIFISLLRGDFDSILFYPFTYDITLCLCDQSGQRKHIVSTIKPDPNSSSFTRPISEKNEEIGIIKFCSLNYLTDAQSLYVRDGIFFIKVFIDFMNTGLHPFT